MNKKTDSQKQDRLNPLLDSLGIQIETTKVAQLDQMAIRLLEENKRTNLTAIRDYDEVLVRHLVDSLQPLALGWKLPGRAGCDIGTGAGFPGLVLSILFPECRWILVETVGRKVAWLERISQEIGIKNVSLLPKRAEEIGRETACRDQFDLCLSRAVAQATTMLEYCLPLLREGGELWAWQGSDFDSGQWENALSELNGKIVDQATYILPEEDPPRERYLIKVKKIGVTPERYPRKVGIPKKRPL